MRRLGRWLLTIIIAATAWSKRRNPRNDRPDRIVERPEGHDPRAELMVLLLLGCATLSALAFMVVYAIDPDRHRTQYLGIALALAFAFLAAALTVVGQRLVVTEDLEDEYPPDEGDPEAQEDLRQIVREGGDGLTRKRLLVAGGATAATALGAALVTPALSLGPWLDTDALKDSPWRRGLRLIDEGGKPLFADQVAEGTFYTAFPEHANRDALGASVVVVRLPESDLKLPAERRAWAPMGILAYSKICTHAGCAIALYRTPKFAPKQPRPALVCPCHYSTFDPATGGEVLFGPAGRPLPQLPLTIGHDGIVRAAGNFSGPIGPSWSGVRRGPAT
jgi:ubiquinol-cytochrome c reductase iron-sulfur subunit